MTIEAAIKDAMARMIQREENIRNVIVSSWEEEFETDNFYSGCSCEYTETNYYIDITYTVVGNPTYKYYRFPGSFAKLIKELDTDD